MNSLARVKLRQNGIVSFKIRLDARGERRSYETTINLGSISSNLHQFLVGAASSREKNSLYSYYRMIFRRRGVHCDMDRHSCEGRNPENSVLNSLDARLREHDGKKPETSNR
jgi:hypothetical protein